MVFSLFSLYSNSSIQYNFHVLFYFYKTWTTRHWTSLQHTHPTDTWLCVDMSTSRLESNYLSILPTNYTKQQTHRNVGKTNLKIIEAFEMSSMCAFWIGEYQSWNVQRLGRVRKCPKNMIFVRIHNYLVEFRKTFDEKKLENAFFMWKWRYEVSRNRVSICDIWTHTRYKDYL